MRIGLFLKYDREVVNGSENREIPDLWGRVDRYAIGDIRDIPEDHNTLRERDIRFNRK